MSASECGMRNSDGPYSSEICVRSWQKQSSGSQPQAKQGSRKTIETQAPLSQLALLSSPSFSRTEHRNHSPLKV